MNELLERFAQTIRTRKLFGRGARFLVAVSGGVDSMVLLHLLKSLAPSNRWQFSVAHFNHQLRGRASDTDERFVQREAQKLGLKTITGRGDVKSFATRNGISIEMAARQLRHEFLTQTARRLNIRTIALAHHADDRVELFFLRVLRGTGHEGLAGMKWRSPSPFDSRVKLVRPLLDIGKADLEEFARENGVRFRQDASNACLNLFRNRVRHELLPLLKSRYQPALDKVVSRLMDIAREESAFASETAADWLKHRKPPFDRLPVAVQRHVLRLQLNKLGVVSDFDLVEALRGTDGKTFSTQPDILVSRNADGLVEMHPQHSTAFDAAQLALSIGRDTGATIFADVRCRWRVVSRKGRARLKSVPGREHFDADRVGDRILLRHWRAGDRFQPIGMASAVKIQDWFMNLKIPRDTRHKLLLAESESGDIFWVEGLRIGERFKLTPATRRQLV
ncbi:MAG TPA: tRNA lysidine(34) synthetase TilS, partial [Verrucomicrobiota bacterium]|nr:tRNA lysidine(34) synthetase TilS [Verrucomicrobiota bacterium]